MVCGLFVGGSVAVVVDACVKDVKVVTCIALDDVSTSDSSVGMGVVVVVAKLIKFVVTSFSGIVSSSDF